MSEMPGNHCCPVLAMKIFLSKRCQCQVLWQKPKYHKAMNSALQVMSGTVYCNTLLGKHMLENRPSEKSKMQDRLLSTLHIVFEPPL